MFSFFKKKPPIPVAPPAEAPSTRPGAAPAAPAAPAASVASPAPAASGGGLIGSALVTPIAIPVPGAAPPERERWLSKLQDGLRKTGSSISTVFTGSRIDDALYEDLETALLMADAGTKA